MELYIHVPFCVKKCNYCDFLSFPGFGCDADERHRSLSCRYVDALCRQIREIGRGLKKLPTVDSRSGLKHQITSCFIGGGTPSVLDMVESEKVLASIWDLMGKDFDGNPKKDHGFEFTVECNPGTVTREKLLLYRKYGVNRLSFGLQSADDEILKRLGRIHTYGEFVDGFLLARECGFDNINIDLISAVPGQTLENWKDTLRKVVGLNPEHISAYSLILEEGTPLYGDYVKNPASLGLPDEETEREIYHITRKILKENGYDRYEVSNYAKTGYGCRHNIGYWTGEEYVGIGLGAASYLSEESFSALFGNPLQKSYTESGENMLRLKNQDDIDRYIAFYLEENAADTVNGPEGKSGTAIADVEEVLDKGAQMSEFCILGLRMCKGISKQEFSNRFGKELYGCFGDAIRKHVSLGLLEEKDDWIRCTSKGMDLNNSVLCDFMMLRSKV